MVEAGRDLASVEEPDGTVIVAPAVDLINGRSTFSTVMGYLPPWIRPWVKRVTPYVAPGSREAAADLLGVGHETRRLFVCMLIDPAACRLSEIG